MGVTMTVARAEAREAETVAELVGELLAEITQAIDTPAFDFDLTQAIDTAREMMARERYIALVARQDDAPAGIITLCESHALNAGGPFGTIPELYVRPALRGAGVGRALLEAAKAFGVERGWTRLEVTTPPLPAFERTLAFYQREGFAVTGGRKLKVLL